MVNSSQDWERRIATFSIEDLLQVFWIFYGDAGKNKEKWSRFRKESIINQACIFWRLLKKPNLTHPSCANPDFVLPCEWILKGELIGWFTRTFSWCIDLVKKGAVWGFTSLFRTLLLYCCHDFVHDFCLVLSHFCHLTWYIAHAFCICPQLLVNGSDKKPLTTWKSMWGHQCYHHAC